MSKACPHLSLTAIILAGGQSSRMGTDKALIFVRNVPLLTRTCIIAQGCADGVYILARSQRYNSIVPKGCCVVQESGPACGPLAAFAQGLALVKTPWVLLLACDLPLLQESVLLEWSSYLAQTPPSVIALLPRRSQRWEPLCGFYRRCCLPKLQTFIDEGGNSFQRWLNQQPVQELPVANPQALFNCNTPSDLQRAASLLRNDSRYCSSR